ncbi:MAG: DNA polymerase III subunit gamma/tau [Clostridia bacterium]|nr:DNA polymerase III subunit gamma/tau [Clostridia bacterium]
MAYQALYRKWRPLTFEDVVGQSHITTTLKNEILSGRTSHAYLFTGIRGTGKTSIAKILSRAVNCLDSKDGNPCNECSSCKGILDGSILDVVEIDAASNNGVDNIRELRDDVVYTASAVKYKVYIIDEVHMLSSGAFNALLKTLEEPPAHVIFILATTEVQKLPQTILSRCQRFDFRSITNADIAERLNEIALADGTKVDEDALMLLSSAAEGSMRDAISILDRCIAFSQEHITYNDAVNILGIADNKLSLGVLENIANSDASSAMKLIGEGVMGGKTPLQITNALMKSARNLMLLKLSSDNKNTVEASKEDIEKMLSLCESFTPEKILNCIKVLSETANAVKFAASPRVSLELGIIKLCMPVFDNSVEAMADRMAQIEKQLQDGIKVSVAASSAPATAAAPAPEEKPPKKKEIEFKGKYKDKWDEIVTKIKSANPGVAGFLKNLKPAGEGDVLLLIANSEAGANAVNFLSGNNHFKDTIASGVESVCGTSPKKIEFELNVTDKQNEKLIDKIKDFDFINIHD